MGVAAPLSPGLRALLETRVDSFDKLEILMAVRRSGGVAKIAEIAEATNLDRDDVTRAARELATAGLLERTSNSEIKAVTTAPGSALEELAEFYEKDKATLVVVIAETAMARLRNLAGRALAEAFVIRKKPGGNDDG